VVTRLWHHSFFFSSCCLFIAWHSHRIIIAEYLICFFSVTSAVLSVLQPFLFCHIYSQTQILMPYWSLELCQDVFSPWLVGEKNMKEICTQAVRAVYSCAVSWSCENPLRIGEFLYVFLSFSSPLCPLPLSMLTSEVHFTHSLTFYLSHLFYIPPYAHIAPLMFVFYTFLGTFLFSHIILNVSLLYTLVLYSIWSIWNRQNLQQLHSSLVHSKICLGLG